MLNSYVMPTTNAMQGSLHINYAKTEPVNISRMFADFAGIANDIEDMKQYPELKELYSAEDVAGALSGVRKQTEFELMRGILKAK